MKVTTETPSETTRNTVPFDQSGPSPFKTNNNWEANYGRNGQEGCSNKQWMSNNLHVQSQQPSTKGQTKHETHYGNNNIPRNQSSSSERPKSKSI